MKYEYKKGDRVRVINADSHTGIYNGFETEVEDDLSTNDDKDELYIVDKRGYKTYYHVYRFEKIKKGKQVPEVLHLVLIDSCKNFVSVESNYKAAESKAKDNSESVTIYKLVPVAQVSSERRVKKIRGK